MPLRRAGMMTRRKLLGIAAAVTVGSLAARAWAYAASPYKSDGVTDNLPAIDERLAEIRRAGRGTLELPAGRLLVAPSGKDGKVALLLPHGTTLKGAGRDKTFIVMAAGAVGHVINAPEGGIVISDLTVDGQSRLRQGAVGHNIRVEGDDILLERLASINSKSYGIGIGQRRYVRRCVLRDVTVLNPEEDGIDVKNPLGITQLSLNGIYVSGKDTQRARKNSAGIDLRGDFIASDLIVEDMWGRTGVRFRPRTKEQGQSKGTDITIRRAQTAFALLKDGAEIEGLTIAGAVAGVGIGATNVTLSGNAIAADHCIVVYRHRDPGPALFRKIRFTGQPWPRNARVSLLAFEECSFSNCVGPADFQSAAQLSGASIDASCRK
jgi:hypothetical protein